MIILERDGSLRRDERAQERARASGTRWEQLARRAGAVMAQLRDGVDHGWQPAVAVPPARASLELEHNGLSRR